MEKKCSIPGCDKKHLALGYCSKHRARFLRNGTTESLYDRAGYDPLDEIKDTRKGHRGNYAVNIVNDIKAKARKRKKEWGLTHRQAFDLIKSPCHYCGHTPDWPKERGGIDRIDNSIGYIFENCAPSCFTCNSAKGIMGKEKFKEWIKDLYQNFLLKSHITSECSHPNQTEFGADIWCKLCRTKHFG